jgi:phosphoribosylaminoimidazolecarboxamide formyltransferase / IMP cyclohydrolase
VLNLQYRAGASRADMDNAVEAWLQGETSDVLVGNPPPLSAPERAAWLSQLHAIAMASDGLIPFRDNLDRAARSGVEYLWQPGGAARDDQIIAAANEHKMVMCFSARRLFHH